MSLMVDTLFFRLGPCHLAVELHLVSSVLALEEAQGMAQLDPRPFLFDRSSPEEPPEDRSHARVGLLNVGGPPMVLFLGELFGTAQVGARDLLPLPPWLSAHLPPILKPACLLREQKVVWLLDLDTLIRAQRS